jgi:hypothetical protein
MKVLSKSFAAAAMFAAGLATAGAANAVVSPFGGAATGTDPLGNSWVASNASAPSWGEPGLGLGVLSFNSANVNNNFGTYATRFSFIFLEGVAGHVVQSATNNFFDTRFEDVTTGQFWTKTYVGSDKVVFEAPTGSKISKGDQFFVNVAFSGPVNTNKFSFAGLWSDASLGVPEPATWAMMLMGFGLIGVTARRQRRGAQAA